VRGLATDPTAPGGIHFVDDLPEPEPRPNELVLEVRAYSVNRGELALIRQRTDGWRPGQDVAGVVAQASADGGPAAGTRVVGVVDWHGWAERVAVPIDTVVELPELVTFEQAASLPIAGITAVRVLRVAGSILGRRLLATGAVGGVGHFVVQLAAAGGAEVTAYVSGPDREELARSLGAHEVVWSLDEESLGPFDIVLDALGGEALAAALLRMVPEGTAATYGVLLGPSELSLGSFRAARNGALIGVFHAHPPETRGEDLRTLVRLVAEERLRPHLGLVLDWQRTVDVLEALHARQVRGKAVLTRT
jgi:NADPH:quinone reductase-like Zn-dependent oxidoreductase